MHRHNNKAEGGDCCSRVIRARTSLRLRFIAIAAAAPPGILVFLALQPPPSGRRASVSV
jgi:hypothetical protein